jgi:hypothetical protein
LGERVRFTPSNLEGSYENLATMREMLTVPDYPEQAELDVFKSDFTFGESADYSLQVAQQSGPRG